jgi:hypothetical protein
MRHPSNLEKTTIRLTEADRKVLQRLTELTGLKQSQAIRAALRALLRRVEQPVEKWRYADTLCPQFSSGSLEVQV